MWQHTKSTSCSWLTLSLIYSFALPVCFWMGGNSSVYAQELVHRYAGHTSSVLTAAFSPDGNYLLSGSEDYSAKLWDVASGKCLQTFAGHAYGVHSVAFSPDGKHMVARTADHMIKLVQLETGQSTVAFKGHTAAIYGVAFCPDGSLMISGSGDKTIKVWDTKTGKSLHTLVGHVAGVRSVAFGPDCQLALSASWDKTIKVWDIRTAKCLRTLKGTAAAPHLAMNPDGNHFLTATDDFSLQLWEIASGKLVRTFKGHSSNVLSLAISPNGKYALSGALDGTAKLWDIATGVCIHTFPKEATSIGCVAFSPQNRVLAGSLDMKLWEVSLSTQSQVQKIVQKKLKPWQAKGKYESTEDYKLRVNETTLKQKQHLFSQEVIDSLGYANSENFVVSNLEYNPDKKMFDIEFAAPDLANLLLPVPAAEAESFESNQEKLRFANAQFHLTDLDGFELTQIEVLNPANGKKYIIGGKKMASSTNLAAKTETRTSEEVASNPTAKTTGRPPRFSIVQPRAEHGKPYQHTEKKLLVKGTVQAEAGLFLLLVQGVETAVRSDGSFEAEVPLAYNENTVVLKAIDKQNRIGLDTLAVFRPFDNSAAIVEGRKGVDYALIIATDDYQNFKKLSNPINDGMAISTELATNYGFKTELVKNPTRAELYTVLRSYSKRQFADEDQLFIFIAGHGEFDPVFSEGYIVTTDSKLNDEIKESFVAHSNVRTIINNIPCKHILLGMDVCFGGTFDQFVAGSRGGEEPYSGVEKEKFIRRKLQLTTRKYLTSGGKEYVPDGRPGFHSPFAAKLLTAFRTYGGEDKILTFNELFSIVDKAVPGPKTGEFGNNQPGSDFLFIAK